MKHISGNVTRGKLEAWMEENKSHMELYEDGANGNKGVYRRDMGPAMSFETRGRTWREVARSVGAIDEDYDA